MKKKSGYVESLLEFELLSLNYSWFFEKFCLEIEEVVFERNAYGLFVSTNQSHILCA